MACGSCHTGESEGICEVWVDSASPVHADETVAELTLSILSCDL